MPQLSEILDMLRQQRDECREAKDSAAEEAQRLRDEAAMDRERAKEECDARIRQLEEELARTREELELERGQRRQEELERVERERADRDERDEAFRTQLSDITNLVQEQSEGLARKSQLMDERWAEKEGRRVDKQARSDAMNEMLERIIREREEERDERQRQREADAERPGNVPCLAHFLTCIADGK